MKKSFVLELSEAEKQSLKQHRIRKDQLQDYAPGEIAMILQATPQRAKEVSAYLEFQSIPSLGVGFARELIGQGFYSLKELEGRDAVTLYHNYEKHCGAWADPCVEDSYRLLAYYIETKDPGKRWWDFTAERKAYRQKNGYPADRPVKPWYELEQYRQKTKPTR